MWAAEIGGNDRVNAIFEARIDPKARKERPQQHSSNTERAAFLKAKYVEQRYLDVSKYALCRGKRIPDSTADNERLSKHLRGGGFESPPPVSRKGSLNSHNSNTNTPVTPKVVKPSLFFTLDTPTEHDQIDSDDDLFADSATTTSDLFGKGNNNTNILRSMSSFDGPIIPEGDEDEDPHVDSVAGFDDPFAEEDENDDEEREIAYPNMAMSVSDISAFQSLGSTFNGVVSSAHSSNCGTTRTIKRPPSPLHNRTASLPPLYSQPSIEELEQQKQQAIKQEDYLKAAEIKRRITAVLNPPNQTEINNLESLKKLAVRQEDYVRAAELKAKIEELRNQRRSNRQLMVESSMNSVMAMAKRSDSPACHRRSLDTFFERHEDEDLQRAVQQGLKRANAASDFEDESIQLSHLGRQDGAHSFHQRSNDVSERFTRSIAEASQTSKLDTNGFVVDDSDRKIENVDKAHLQSKPSQPLSRRNSRTPSRESNEVSGPGKPSRSRSLKRKQTFRQSSTGISSEQKELSQRRRSKSRDRKSDRRERSKSRDRKSQKDKGRSKREGESNDKQRRPRSKSRDRKNAQKDKDRKNRSKSRDKKHSERSGRACREPISSVGNKPRSRSKSQSRNQARRKKPSILTTSSEVFDMTPQIPLPPRAPEKRKPSPRPDNPRQASTQSRRVTNAGDMEKAILKAHHSADDISFNSSFRSNASDKIQSAHHRDSRGHVAKSRRTLHSSEEKEDVPNPPNCKGSRSLHVSHSFFDFEGAKDKNFFIDEAPISTPPVVSRKSKPACDMETPALKERKLSISSPAGVDEFPFIASPVTPRPSQEAVDVASPASTRSTDISAKYRREVERTAARLERLRRNRRNEANTDLRLAKH
jgi:hypothetical protein